MLIKIIMIILILSPICNGITYLFVSNHPSSPYCTVAKYKTLDDTYKYKNKQAGIVYICLGFIIALFLLLLCFLYNFFDSINPISKIFGLYIIIFLIIVALSIITYFILKKASKIDNEIETKTFAIKELTAKAEYLMEKTDSVEIKEICEKVYESLRYSDTMSKNNLKEINEQIQREFASFEDAVNNEDTELAKNISKQLISLIEKRNIKCKMTKNSKIFKVI